MPRVLIVTKHRTGGGTEKHVADIVSGLQGRIDIEAAYLEDGFWPLHWQIERGGYDIVHFFLPRPYVLGSLACRLAGHKTIIMSRRSLVSCYQTPAIRFIEKHTHKHTKILVGNSPAVCDELREEAPDADIRMIRSGVTIRPFGRIPSTVFTILCVANAFAYKGHDDLLGAIRRIGPALPEPWQLLLAGRGTEKFNGFRVIGMGYQDHVAQLYASADLFILPSHEEGSSNALLEAMTCGVPVIATDVGGNKDAVIHGQTGLLVSPRSPAKLAMAIQALAAAPMMRQRMAEQAQIDVAKRFGFERCLDEYETLYHSALEGSGTVHRTLHQVG